MSLRSQSLLKRSLFQPRSRKQRKQNLHLLKYPKKPQEQKQQFRQFRRKQGLGIKQKQQSEKRFKQTFHRKAKPLRLLKRKC